MTTILYTAYATACTTLGVLLGEWLTHGTHGLALALILACINVAVSWLIVGRRKAHA